jgi:predicted glycosyltransferase involved in capsule biosynthesis
MMSYLDLLIIIEHNQTINICGGMSIFRKDSILRIGGWCEEFSGWGGEDDYLTILVKKLLKYKEMPYRCYHLYHSRDKMDMQQYQKSLNLLNKLGSTPDDELFRFANNNRAKNSFINKYDK